MPHLLRLLGFLLPALTACAHSPPVLMPAPQDLSGIHVRTDGLIESEAGVVGIGGVATNTSGRDVKMVVIYFDVLDATGAKVSDALASDEGLKAGEDWRFQATFTNAFPVTLKQVRLNRVQVF